MKGLKFVIYRIIGNTLPPRHGPGDTCSNLKFVLENEPNLPSCEKRWVLNRFVDPELEAVCIKLICASGQKYHSVALDETSYRNAFLDASGMPKTMNPFAPGRSGKLDSQSLAQSKEWIIRHKSLVAINLNDARNRAIELGRADALWTLPLDGWCYFTAEAWNSFAESIARNKDALYGALPLARLNDNAQLKTMATVPEPVDEPQIAFHRDAPDRFHEGLRYGNQNKSELLTRLGVPGPWAKWKLSYWDTTPQLEAIAPGRFFVGGWVYRLASSAGDRVETNSASRFVARVEGAHRFVQQLDTALLQKSNTENRGHNYCVLQPGSVHSRSGQVQKLLELAEAVLAKPTRRVIDKTEMPPGCKRNDYYILPPYVHNIDGTNIDGRSAATFAAGTNGSRSYDRGALRECFSHTSILAASGVLCRRRVFLRRAAETLAIWFIDKDTAMTPSAQFAQWKSDASAGNFAGLIEFRQLWTLPYLSRTLLINGALSKPQFEAIKQWAVNFLVYLVQSEQGQRAIMAGNNIGTWTHLVFVSLAIFTENFATAAAQINNASLRLAAQCEVIGVQSFELTRTRPLHYSFFNLTAWILLANLGRSVGFDLWNYRGIEGQSICRMMHFIQTNMAHFPEYQDQPAKYVEWFESLLLLVPPAAADRSLLVQQTQVADRIWTDDPDLGLPPQWPFFLPLYRR